MATSKRVVKKPPRIRARNRGSTMSIMDAVAEPYKEAHPDKAVRWVYSPEHNNTMSQIYKRQAQGYALIDPTDEDIVYPHGITGSVVRVADLVLMSIDKELREEDEIQAQELAEREANKSRDSYLQAQGRLSAGKHTGVGTGGVKASTEDIEVKVPGDEE